TLWQSKQIPPKGQNVAFYVNPVVDELYDKILAELDEGKRRELYVGIVEQWTKDIPSIPLYFRADPYVHKANIVGIKPTGTADPVAWNVWEWDRK
ncbi:peptide ABC transporter substrate-binding protein, partial [Candidatus Bipolaricaulota bacterium]|nr:peptide ABC transporter substrate-binding protein [Candidatus Bipolaricaulota bacterium]